MVWLLDDHDGEARLVVLLHAELPDSQQLELEHNVELTIGYFILWSVGCSPQQKQVFLILRGRSFMILAALARTEQRTSSCEMGQHLLPCHLYPLFDWFPLQSQEHSQLVCDNAAHGPIIHEHDGGFQVGKDDLDHK